MKITFPILIGLINLVVMASGCSIEYTLNKLNKKNYKLVINDIDTLQFDKLYLDRNIKQQFVIDKQNKIISLRTTELTEQILSIEEIGKMYSRDSVSVAFIVFDGNIYSTSISNEKVYFQYSLVTEIERIKREDQQGGICFHPPQGDLIIIK